MNIQYFKSSWGDIRNSPGWFGKLCLLALLNFIPIFGQIVTFAYLYGWAREIAWGTHEPLPRKIFSNDDGKFWRRGWFVLVLAFVFSLIPQIVLQFGNYFQTMAVMSAYGGSHGASNPAFGMLGSLFSLIGILCAVLMNVLSWIGGMRVSIYDRLSSGFQFGKLWKMLRHDTTGILKIFGMSLLFSFILGIVLSIIISILIFIVVFAGVTGLMNAGYTAQSIQQMTESQAITMILQLVSSTGFVGLLAVLVGVFLSLLAGVFINMLAVRAMGYWTMQFDVPHWRGQDEPLPFEVAGAAQPQPQPQPPVYMAQQPQQDPYAQPYGQTQPGQPYTTTPDPASQPPYQASAADPSAGPGYIMPQGQTYAPQEPTSQSPYQPQVGEGSAGSEYATPQAAVEASPNPYAAPEQPSQDYGAPAEPAPADTAATGDAPTAAEPDGALGNDPSGDASER